MSTQVGHVTVGRVDIALAGAESHRFRVVEANTRVIYNFVCGITFHLKFQSTSPKLTINATNRSESQGGIIRSVTATFDYNCTAVPLECKSSKGDFYATWTITAHKRGCRCER
jgi:hypothetical protein